MVFHSWPPLPGLLSKGRAGAAGPEAHPCMKIFRDPGEKGDQNSGGGREKEGVEATQKIQTGAEMGSEYRPAVSFISSEISAPRVQPGWAVKTSRAGLQSHSIRVKILSSL